MLLQNVVFGFIQIAQAAPTDVASLGTSISTFITAIQTIVMTIGAAVGVIGILVGGMMRATAFGNESKVARSNQAIAAAVVGLIIVGGAAALGTIAQSVLK